MGCFSFALLLLTGSASTTAAENLESCRGLDDAARLRCYDDIAARNALQPAPNVAAEAAAKPEPAAAVSAARSNDSAMSKFWELDEKGGPFRFTFYQPNYILPFTWGTNVNRSPNSPGEKSAFNGDLNYHQAELKYQLSFKTKLWENVIGDWSDLWFGYTQQSFWQIYAPDLSRPFRETDYEPEAMLIARTNYRIFGLDGKLVGLGIVHQSNGRADPLSRSWNRAYVLVGLERDNFSLQIKPWYRLPETAENDDNPDITRYVGRAEVLASYKAPAENVLALRLRTTFETHPGWGSAQLNWSFPLLKGLRGYAQVFTGYGDSLIDYNFHNTVVGVGVSLNQ